MKRITAHIFSSETCIEREDSPEVILCEEKVLKISELREIIRYFWRLDFGDYDLTTINYYDKPAKKVEKCDLTRE